MGAYSLFDTQVAKTTGMLNQTDNVSKFIIKNRYTYLDTNIRDHILNTRVFIQTGISMLMGNIMNSPVVDAFAPMDSALSNDPVPELLASTNVSLDTKQFKDPTLISTYSEFKDKTIINLSHLIKKNTRGSSKPEISDINEIHKLYMRGAFTMSYHDSNGWLTPDLAKYIIQTYAMTISGLIARKHNLTYNEQLTIAGVLSLYMAQLMSHSSEDMTKPLLMMRCNYLGNRQDIETMLEIFSEDVTGLLNADQIKNLIVKHSPDRLKSFSIGEFYRYASALSQEHVPAMIALEYPPYWVYMLMIALSGGKIGLLYQLKQHRLDKDGMVFIKNLISSPTLINKINR